MFVWHRFKLNQNTIEALKNLRDPFEGNDFGKIVFYRTYSRVKEISNSDNGSGSNETWLDVVIRNIEGCFSILKDYYIKNHLSWDESYWQQYSHNMAIMMYQHKWLPAGRGLWAMGTQFMYEEGGMCLASCGFVKIKDYIADAICWLMDCLMLGVGVGFEPIRNQIITYISRGYFDYTIPDSREGWVESVRLLINAFIFPNQKEPRFDYDEIRPSFTPIKRFGGICMGSDSLKILHDQIKYYFTKYYKYQNDPEHNEYYDIVMLKTDIANATGCAVVAGNVRRSAELCKGLIKDKIFLDLKQYNNPRFNYRKDIGWMSNNSAFLDDDEDFNHLGEIAERVIHNAEPGVGNLRNFRYGRIGKKDKLRYDDADGVNPCAEQTLYDKEICTIDDTVPTNCETDEEWLQACEYAGFYAYTETLLPTHQPETNKILARNHRIGVGIIDWIGWKKQKSTHGITRLMRKGYKRIRKITKWLANECGTPEPIKVSTMKPNGTTAKMINKRSGAGYANFRYMIRRMRVQQYSALYNILDQANVPHEPDLLSANTEVFEYPLSFDDGCKTAEEVTIWEQAMNLVLLQREWSDNAVSNTLMFKPKWILKRHIIGEEQCREYKNNMSIIGFDLDNKDYEDKHIKISITNNEEGLNNEIKEYHYNPFHEENDVESVLSAIVPLIKTCSLSPHTAKGVYQQMPEEGISKEEYLKRKASIKPINWNEYSLVSQNTQSPDKYCSTDKCEAQS